METIDYKKKMKVCERLGAKRFQKIVFKVETLKFKTIKKLFPNYIEWYDKLCDRKRDKELKKVNTEEARKRIINHYRRQKLIMRKEFYREQNRNYHVDLNKPTEILHYLNWNKKVHKKGLIKNGFFIPALAIASGIGIAPIITLPLLAIELGSLFINFQCVNIQNYNIYQFKEKEETIKKLEERKIKRNIKNYSEAGAVISRSLEKTDDVPSLHQIIENIQTKEELEQLKNLVQDTLCIAQTTAGQKTTAAKGSGGKK